MQVCSHCRVLWLGHKQLWKHSHLCSNTFSENVSACKGLSWYNKDSSYEKWELSPQPDLVKEICFPLNIPQTQREEHPRAGEAFYKPSTLEGTCPHILGAPQQDVPEGFVLPMVTVR